LDLEDGSWPIGLERIKIFGADVQNPIDHCREAQELSWMPPWLELQYVCLDNQKDFRPQLHECGLYSHSEMFDIVVMRQGLCYCEDHSFQCRPPREVKLAGVAGDPSSWRKDSEGPSGIYGLEQEFRNGRPSYRNGKFLLHWRPDRYDWIVAEDDEAGAVWANVCKDSGSPALAQGTWYVWDGNDYVLDEGVCCHVPGPCPWRRPPCDCKCCAGISLDAVAMQSFIGRVAAVIDQDNPKAFAFLHSGYYKGVPDEVGEFELELEMAAEQFNSSKSCMCASVLRRHKSQDAEDGSPMRYWNQVNGLLLSAFLA
jgi:hypothetical protein